MFLIFPERKTFCSGKLVTAFPPAGYQSTFCHREKSFYCRTMHLVPCNIKLTGETSQDLNISLIRLGIQGRFPLKQQFSRFVPSGSQSTFSFSNKKIRNSYKFIHHFVENLIGLNFSKGVMFFLCEHIFSKIARAFLQQKSIHKLYVSICFEKRKFKFCCFQRKCEWLRIPKLAYAGVSS